MKKSLFDRFRQLAYQHAGISLADGKETLVEARVAKRVRALSLGSTEEYLEVLLHDETGEELIRFLDAISTNFTSFFREPVHFELLANELRRWMDEGQTRFRIWSAASSTGEEPYSIAITLLETAGGKALDAKILATDISTRVLAEASRGRYASARVEPLTAQQRRRWLAPVVDAGAPESAYEVSPELRELVVFKRLNLSLGRTPMQGPMDAIFVRNVMMYFDQPVRQALIREVERLLRDGGLLMIGHAESLTGLSTGLRQLRPSVFRKEAGKRGSLRSPRRSVEDTP